MPHVTREPLTARQQEIYDFIRTSTQEMGYPPSVRDICDHMEIASPNGVMCHVKAMVKKGWLAKGDNKARSLTCIDPMAPTTALPIAGHIRGDGVVKPQQPTKFKLNDIVAGCNICLLVRGNGVAGAGEGDYFVVRAQAAYKPKEVVLWQFGRTVRVTPFSEAPEHAKIQGRVIAKVRPY